MKIRALTTESGFLITEYDVEPDRADILIRVLITNKVRFEVFP